MRVFNCSSVKSTIPTNFKINEPPLITYTYDKNIGSKLLNYSKELKKLDVKQFSDLTDMECDCNHSDFKDIQHNHIITGNLDIIQNIKLRDLMQKGAKFREPAKPNFTKIINNIENSISDNLNKWSKKEGRSINQFNDWKSTVIDLINNRIDFLEAKYDATNFKEQVLYDTEVNKYISEILHKKFVVTVIDKASNNFAVICKKFYFTRLATELGFHLNHLGNETYQVVQQTPHNLCQDLAAIQKQLFNIDVKPERFNLPILYWIPKFHKSPIGTRFIAGSKNKVLTQLEKIVQSILTLFESHFQNYCNVIKNNTGFKHYFSISNSSQALDIIQGIKDSKTFDRFDFSNLYTNFDHTDLFKKFEWLLQLLFDNSKKNCGKTFVRITNHPLSPRAYW